MKSNFMNNITIHDENAPPVGRTTSTLKRKSTSASNDAIKPRGFRRIEFTPKIIHPRAQTQVKSAFCIHQIELNRFFLFFLQLNTYIYIYIYIYI